MRRLALAFALFSLAAAASPPQSPREVLLDGDLVFQTSRSSQSAAIRLATHSPYSHVGIVEVAEDGVFVIEAIQPVSRTPLAKWRERGQGGRWTVMRDPSLTDAQRARIVAEARKELGKPYDFKFGWDDDALYCSELVRKVFARAAGRSLGQLQSLGSLDLSALRPALEGRYGRGKIPLDQALVTPASLAADASLTQVKSDFRLPRVAARSPAPRR